MKMKNIDEKTLNEYAKSKDYEKRYMAAKIGRDKDLDILVHDKIDMVRSTVATKGRNKDLDILVHDNCRFVREQVARIGRNKDLDILVHDSDAIVRTIVAEQAREQDLNILIHDDKWIVRRSVAETGLPACLDILVHDKDCRVKKAVLKFARPQDLEILSNDTDSEIRNQAHVMLEEMLKKHEKKEKEENFNFNFRKLAYELYKEYWVDFHISKERLMDTRRKYIRDCKMCVDEKLKISTYEEWIAENGFDGELYVCFDEFCENEYMDWKFMVYLLNDEDLIAMYKEDVKY